MQHGGLQKYLFIVCFYIKQLFFGAWQIKLLQGVGPKADTTGAVEWRVS